MSWRDHWGEYSVKERKFCLDLEKAGLDKYIIPDFSAKLMFGRSCPAIRTRSKTTEGDSFDEPFIRLLTTVKYKTLRDGDELIIYSG